MAFLSLEAVLKDTLPFTAANATLLWTLQEASKYVNEHYTKRTTLEDVTEYGLIGAGGLFYLHLILPRMRDIYQGNKSLKEKIISAVGYVIPSPLVLYALHEAAPSFTGMAEEAVQTGLFLGAVYAANKYFIFPGVKALRGAVSKWTNLAKYGIAGVLTLGLGFTHNIQNTVRDLHNTGVAISHRFVSPNNRSLKAYWMQYGLAAPVDDGFITSRFGYRRAIQKDQAQFHDGIDIGVPAGTPVKAVAGGVVSHVSGTGTDRKIIVLHKEGIVSVYKHNSEISKKEGESVYQGENIASSGEAGTGPHLHFILLDNGKPVNPL